MQLSKIGLGTFPFSNLFTKINQNTAEKIVEEYFSHGGNYIETAPIYPVNKIDLSSILKTYPRSSYYVGSKCAFNVINEQKIISGKSNFIREECLKEIERLNCDYIDLLQTHRTPSGEEIGELIETLSELKRENLINHIGLSNVTLHDLKNISQHIPVEWLQIRLSMIHTHEYTDVIEYCEANSIKLNVYQVIERGQLMPNQTPRKNDDLRNKKNEYTGEQNKEITDWFDRVSKTIHKEYNLLPEHISIHWALSQKCVESCVVGATNVAQIKSAIKASELNTNENIIHFIDQEYIKLQKHIFDKYHCTLKDFRGAIL